MVINNFKRDIEGMLGEKTQTELARDLGVVRETVKSYILDAGVTGAYVSLIEGLGYDINVTYIKGSEGVLTDFKEDFNRLIEKTGYRKSELAREMGVAPDWPRGAVKRANITYGLRRVCSALGYGIKLEYIPYMK